jgi:hypothetical protein
MLRRLLKEVGSFHGQSKDDEEPIYDLAETWRSGF